MSDQAVTAGSLLVESLRSLDVDHVFGLVGADLVEILDALHDRRDLRYVGVRHEQAAAHMADAYARSSGRAGVCMACGGPGATNLVTGVTSAQVNHSPMIAILGSPPTTLIHRDSFQEIDQVSLFRPITKAQLVVSQASRIPELAQRAFQLAHHGRKGPVLLMIPRDISNQTVTPTRLPSSGRPSRRKPTRGSHEAAEHAAAALTSSERPVVLAGAGAKWAEAHSEIGELATTLGAALITSYASNDCVDNRHPCFVGSLGRAGAPEAAETIRQADVLLVIGSGLGHFTTFFDHRYISPDTTIVQIDIDGSESGDTSKPRSASKAMLERSPPT